MDCEGTIKRENKLNEFLGLNCIIRLYNGTRYFVDTFYRFFK